jgi:SET domain/AWS domain
LLTKAVQDVPVLVTSANAEKFAARGAVVGSFDVDDYVRSDGKNKADYSDPFDSALDVGNDAAEDKTVQRNRVIRLRVLAFTATLFGLCGKSYEDGTWNPEHVCSLQVMLRSANLQAKRSLGSLYQRLVNLQRALERCIVDSTMSVSHEVKTQIPLLSVDEANRYMFVVDLVRRRFLDMSRSDRKSLSVDGEDETCLAMDRKESASQKAVSAIVSLRMPDITKVLELRRVVASEEGWIAFDAQAELLGVLHIQMAAAGEDLLSRFDPKFDKPAKWKRTSKTNLYRSKTTRDLVGPKILPCVCSCIPGVVSKGTNFGQDSQFACSNDMCANRVVKIECDPKTCPAGDTCQNQKMQRMQYARVTKVSRDAKGQGIVAAEDMEPGTFIGEYQGEVVDAVEFKKRKAQYRGERHFYFMELTNKLYIDASRVAQITRFINHSCDPNARTQKWNAGGEPRVGIFADRTIRCGEEITFDYGTRFVGAKDEPVACLCGSEKCRGYLMSRKPECNGDDAMVHDFGRAVERRSDDGAEEIDDKSRDAKDLRDENIAKGKIRLAIAAELKKKAAEAANSQNVTTVSIEGTCPNQSTAIERLSKWERSVKNDLEAGLCEVRIPKKTNLVDDAPVSSDIPPRMPVKIPRKSPTDQPSIVSIPRKSPQVIKEQQRQKLHSQQNSKLKERFNKSGGTGDGGSVAACGRKPALGGYISKYRGTGGSATFAPVKKSIDRNAGGNLAPVVRNRSKRERKLAAEDGYDSDSSDDLSAASSIVPVEDDAIFLPEFDVDRGANSDDEFVEAPPIPGFDDDDVQDGFARGTERTPELSCDVLVQGVPPFDGGHGASPTSHHVGSHLRSVQPLAPVHQHWREQRHQDLYAVGTGHHGPRNLHSATAGLVHIPPVHSYSTLNEQRHIQHKVEHGAISPAPVQPDRAGPHAGNFSRGPPPQPPLRRYPPVAAGHVSKYRGHVVKPESVLFDDDYSNQMLTGDAGRHHDGYMFHPSQAGGRLGRPTSELYQSPNVGVRVATDRDHVTYDHQRAALQSQQRPSHPIATRGDKLQLSVPPSSSLSAPYPGEYEHAHRYVRSSPLPVPIDSQVGVQPGEYMRHTLKTRQHQQEGLNGPSYMHPDISTRDDSFRLANIGHSHDQLLVSADPWMQSASGCVGDMLDEMEVNTDRVPHGVAAGHQQHASGFPRQPSPCAMEDQARGRPVARMFDVKPGVRRIVRSASPPEMMEVDRVASWNRALPPQQPEPRTQTQPQPRLQPQPQSQRYRQPQPQPQLRPRAESHFRAQRQQRPQPQRQPLPYPPPCTDGMGRKVTDLRRRIIEKKSRSASNDS